MREKDIHNLIEQEEAEAKQRIWERIKPQLDLEPRPKQQPVVKKKTWKWATLAIALVCIVTLSIVLPLTLRDDGPKVRYCDVNEYIISDLGQTLREYTVEHEEKFMYVDWYDIAEERNSRYAYLVEDENDIVFFEEYFINGETGEELNFAVTDSRTRVDRFDAYYDNCEELVVKNLTVNIKSFSRKDSYATFEYKGYIYYLQLSFGDGQERLVEIIEDMLK